MTWVERTVDAATDSMWAVVHTPTADGIFCVFGDVWYGKHAHLLDIGGNATGVFVAWEDD